MGLKFFGKKATVGVDIETSPDTVAIYQVESRQPKPRKVERDADHHALYWLFGRRNTNVRPIESPKPLGKRARRRLRGRLKGEMRLATARLGHRPVKEIDWDF